METGSTGLLVELVQGAAYKDAAVMLDAMLHESNFKVVLKDLAEVLFTSQVDNDTSLDFIVHCLLYCQTHLSATSPGLKHLLLELITPQAASQASPFVKAGAVQLFHAYCTVTDAKLAAKVALIFNLTREDLEDWNQVALAVQQLLQSQTSYKAAVHIMIQFEGIHEAIDKSEVITQMVADGQENLCQQWVTGLGKDYQVEFVEACVALDKLKPAARAVRQLGLQAEFPNLEALYRQRSLARLVGKRLWSVALSFVGSDTVLQTTLVRDMAEVGEVSLADEYRKQLGLPESVLTLNPEQIAAQEAARRQQYLQIEQYMENEEQLLFVADEAGLRRAHDALGGSDVLGMDVEWKPSHVAGVTSPAAILQVASRQVAVLFDLLSLAQHHPAALDACLQPLFKSAGTLKLGFEVSGDLAKLATSWPQIQAFRYVAGVLDLKPLWVAHGVSTRQQGASVRLLSAVGLSSLCKSLLGKGLDKSQQMSDWTSRPLTTRQIHYAALDALVLPQLYDVLRRELGPQQHQRLLQQHVQTFVRSAKTPPAAAVSTAAVVDVASDAACAVGTCSTVGQQPTTVDAAGGRGANSCAGGDTAAGTLAEPASKQQEPGWPRVLAVLQRQDLQDALYWLHSAPVHNTNPQLRASAGPPFSVAVPRSQVAKTMAVLVDLEPLLAVTRGDQRIDMHKAVEAVYDSQAAATSAHMLAAVLDVRRKVIRLAPDSMARQITGFTPGGIAPLGHDRSLKIVIDHRLNPATAADKSSSTQTLHNIYHLQPARSLLAPFGHDELHKKQQNRLEAAAGATTGRGSAVVAAAAVLAAPELSATSEVSNDWTGASQTSCDSSNGDMKSTQQSSGSSHNSSNSPDAPGEDKLFVQCGKHALVVLTYQQLLALTEGQVADIADAPGKAEYKSTALAAAEAVGAGQQLDPHFSGGQQSAPCFLVDSMLGRLCRWLRALGVDAQFVDPGGTLQQRQQLTASDRQQQQNSLIQQIQDAAVQEGRLFLTRDSKLAARRDVGGSVYLLDTDDTAQQLMEISKHFDISFDKQTAMSRCSNCNAAAFQLISKEEAAVQVPHRVMELVDEFWKCGKCGKVFWMGPKSYAALELLGGLFTDGRVKPTPLQSSRPCA